jgi:hypothetical protein
VRMTSSREVYRNAWIRVREDAVERDDGSTGVYGVVEKPHFALVLPAERDGFWLVEQFRYPLGRRAGRLRHLGHLDLAPGLMTQEFDVWLATDLAQGPTAREASEADMRHAFLTEAELRAMITAGRFTDGPSIAAYTLLLLDRA